MTFSSDSSGPCVTGEESPRLHRVLRAKAALPLLNILKVFGLQDELGKASSYQRSGSELGELISSSWQVQRL